MTVRLLLALNCMLVISACSAGADGQLSRAGNNVTALHMKLSNYGVESLSFPAFTVTIDFVNGRSLCQRTNDNPSTTDSTYTLSQNEINQIRKLLANSNLKKLKPEYRAPTTDQPTSFDTLYTDDGIFSIQDYGMIADAPMREIYDIVYKFGR